MIVERKPNGDWVAQAEPEDTAPNQREDLLVLLIWAIDCSLAGDEYCLSNWDMAVDLYDYYTGQTHLPALFQSGRPAARQTHNLLRPRPRVQRRRLGIGGREL